MIHKAQQIKKMQAGKCERCGRMSHFLVKCYVKTAYVKGWGGESQLTCASCRDEAPEWRVDREWQPSWRSQKGVKHDDDD